MKKKIGQETSAPPPYPPKETRPVRLYGCISFPVSNFHMSMHIVPVNIIQMKLQSYEMCLQQLLRASSHVTRITCLDIGSIACHELSSGMNAWWVHKVYHNYEISVICVWDLFIWGGGGGGGGYTFLPVLPDSRTHARMPASPENLAEQGGRGGWGWIVNFSFARAPEIVYSSIPVLKYYIRPKKQCGGGGGSLPESLPKF